MRYVGKSNTGGSVFAVSKSVRYVCEDCKFETQSQDEAIEHEQRTGHQLHGRS